MNELTDLEICRRIAEIENLEHYISENKKYCMTRDKLSTYVIRHVEYNPLTDDALCFKLCFEYGVCIDYESGDVFIRGGDGFDGCLSVIKFEDGCFESLKRAICLAIIKAHK